ncbi:MAG: hypothetical protein IJ083_02960 [Clostridia bacterium]|nr:hypothetical protein [Clostridia bacterium]
MNLLEQIGMHLEALGLGTMADGEHEGNIFWGTMPESPDACISLHATDAGLPGRRGGARIQVVVRGRDDRYAFETCQRIAEEMADWNGYLAYHLARVTVTLINGAQGIGADEQQRVLYSCNLRVHYCDYSDF